MQSKLPAFMRKEPQVDNIPRPLSQAHPEELRKSASKFMNDYDGLLEENAYLRSEKDMLERELKLAREQVRGLDRELNFVRDDRDRLLQHDTAIMNSLENIEALIVSAKNKARAEAYAPPGTGTQEPADPLPAEAQQELAALVATIKPSEARDA
jgi:chromosome segregation ATPase